MPKIAVISTSINPRPRAYEEWSKIGDLIVAGDVNSPSELAQYVDELGGVYLAPDDQGQYECSSWIGWRNIQRRNIALLAALEANAYDYIITVDDDNLPGAAPSFLHQMLDRFEDPSANLLRANTNGWFNPGRVATPPFRQRGLPATYNDSSTWYELDVADDEVNVGVLQCVILGDPDCDAVQRIVNPVSVQSYPYDVYAVPGVYAPFNSQATVWPIKFAPLMAVLPHCERFDDIYASLIATRILHHLNHVIVYGQPRVFQDRNIHNLGKDLAAEVKGMNTVDRLVASLNAIHLPETETDPLALYDQIMGTLEPQGLFLENTFRFVDAFLMDVQL